jgi:vancomycin resistance protein YoaR
LEDRKDQKVSEGANVTEPYGEGNDSNKRSNLRLKHLRSNKYFLITIGLFLIMFFSVSALALIYTHDQQRILEGVTISGINVGNLTKDEAKIVIDKEVHSMLSKTIKLNVGQQAPEVKLEDLGFGINADLAVQEAYAIGRQGSLAEKVSVKMSTKKGVNINFTQKWDEAKLRETIKKTLEVFSDPSTEATFQISNANTMTIKSEHIGNIIDSEALITKIKKINIYELVPEIKVDFKKQTPLLTAAKLEDQKITGVLATFTTHFDSSQAARTENLKIATKALDMAVIKPGDTLSFNKVVGERTVAGGYKDAYIIVNGQFVPGLAGGICQVSSTLYNTGLLANLSVTQRSNHDLAISYVPLGQDATVAYPDLDLKFNNNTGGYLLVRTKITGNTLTIEMYGKVKLGQEVFIANTIDSIIPATEQRVVDEKMVHGASAIKQQGQPGYVVKSVRTVKVNGAVVSSEPLQQSRYLAVPKVFSVGR